MNKYTNNPKDWKSVKVSSEDKAIALLMGLEPESWARYFGFCEKNGGKDKAALSAKGKAAMPFIEEYEGFLRKAFSFIPEVSRYAVLRGWYFAIKERGSWHRDFTAYAQGLYDNGVIFTPETVNALKLSYSPDSWAIQLYKKWLGRKAWTLGEALDLFVGKDPSVFQGKASSRAVAMSSGYPCFIDLRQYGGLTYADLEDLAERSVAANDLSRFSDGHFKPEIITAWLMKTAAYMPPPCLTDVLFPVGEKKLRAISSAALKKAYKVYVEENRHLQHRSWQDDQKAMTNILGTKPTDAQIKKLRSEFAPDAWKRRGRKKSV